MYYEINISKNGEHHFATSDRSITTHTKLLELVEELSKLYTPENGFKITASQVETISRPVDISQPTYGIIITWYGFDGDKNWDLVQEGPLSHTECVTIANSLVGKIGKEERIVIKPYNSLQTMLKPFKS